MKHSHKKLEAFDMRFISFIRKHGDEFARFGLFLIFFWFGILKVFLLSPAGPLVVDLLDSTFLKFMEPNTFLILFGLFEMLIGILILIPKLERITFLILLFHLFTTVMPLWILPDVTWYQAFVPTLVGQYIMKNIALLALGVLLFARLRPMTETHRILGEEEN
jgi:uncharacterized membrane protein YkgB